MDSAIHWINHYPAVKYWETNCAIHWIKIYPSDSAIHLSNNRTKWRTKLSEGFACPIPSSIWPISSGRGRIISGRLANRFGSRYETNIKILRGVIGPISTTNDYLITVFDEVVNLRGSCRNNALLQSSRGKLQLVAILYLRVKSLSLTERNILFVDHRVKWKQWIF